MKNLVMLGVIGAVLFGASYGASQFLLVPGQSQADSAHGKAGDAGHGDDQSDAHGDESGGDHGAAGAPAEHGDEGGHETADEAPGDDHGEPAAEAGGHGGSEGDGHGDAAGHSHDEGFEGPAMAGAAHEKVEKVDAMPVSLRPDQSLSIEAVLQLSDSIRKKEQQLADREQVVVREEDRLKLLFEDLRREQKELEALGDSVDSKISAARELLASLQQQQQLAGSPNSSNGGPASNDGSGATTAAPVDPRVEQARGWIKSLEADQAARYLKEFANQGDLKFAAQLLKSLDDRQAAKILAALNDPVLGTQLVEALAEKTRQ
jgi:hypothetical protein